MNREDKKEEQSDKKKKADKKKKKKKVDDDDSSEGSEDQAKIEQEKKKKQEQERKEKEEKQQKTVYNERFEIHPNRLIGKGSFGEIYVALDNQSRQYCALKLENTKNKNAQLKNERTVIELLKSCEGFPKLIEAGTQNDSNYMVIDLLGPNLSDLFEFCNQKFSLQTVLLIAIQMITRIQDLHSRNYIHRDIKPENFLIGVGKNSNTIYIIDFGLSKKYKDSKMDHMPYKEGKILTGTARYASINNHLGIEQSRRDDLEAIGYVLIYFLKKKLPWQGCQGSTKQEKYNKILEKKLTIPVEILCKEYPIEFSIYMNYCKNLKYNERPDYNFLKALFIDLLYMNYNEKFLFDWTLPNPNDEPPNKKDDKEKEKEKEKFEVQQQSSRTSKTKTAAGGGGLNLQSEFNVDHLKEGMVDHNRAFNIDNDRADNLNVIIPVEHNNYDDTLNNETMIKKFNVDDESFHNKKSERSYQTDAIALEVLNVDKNNVIKFNEEFNKDNLIYNNLNSNREENSVLSVLDKTEIVESNNEDANELMSHVRDLHESSKRNSANKDSEFVQGALSKNINSSQSEVSSKHDKYSIRNEVGGEESQEIQPSSAQRNNQASKKMSFGLYMDQNK